MTTDAPTTHPVPTTSPTPTTSTTSTTSTTLPPSARTYAIGQVRFRWVEPGRVVSYPFAPDGAATGPRVLLARVLYPATGPATSTAVVNGAPPARSDGPFPLVIFGPGLDQFASAYSVILDAWARAGFVVAALRFPVTNPTVPGPPSEKEPDDLHNQAGDMTFAIKTLLADSAQGTGPLAGLLEPNEVAVTGQSDGGNTAIAASRLAAYQDPAVKAAIILSGANYGFGPPGDVMGPGAFAASGPPLLATQGTADQTNPPSFTDDYFMPLPPPKWLLCLDGAHHLPPYQQQNSWSAVVRAVTIHFLYAELYHEPGQLAAMTDAGNVAGVAGFASSCPST